MISTAFAGHMHPEAAVQRATAPVMVGDISAATTFIAIAATFGISSAVTRASSPAGEDIVPSAVAGERNRLAELPTPSVLSILYAAIIGLSVADLADSGVVSDWIANGAVLSELPIGTVGGGLVLIVLFASELAKMRPGDPAAFYNDLEGLEVGSLSKQCGEWALAAKVPTTLNDGTHAIATVAGGCFWGTELHFQRVPGVLATAVGYTQVSTLMHPSAACSVDDLCAVLLVTGACRQAHVQAGELGHHRPCRSADDAVRPVRCLVRCTTEI